MALRDPNLLVEIRPSLSDTFLRNLVDGSDAANVTTTGTITFMDDAGLIGAKIVGPRVGSFANGTNYEGRAVTMVSRFKTGPRSSFSRYLSAQGDSNSYGPRIANNGSSTGSLAFQERLGSGGNDTIGTQAYTTGQIITVVIRTTDSGSNAVWVGKTGRVGTAPDFEKVTGDLVRSSETFNRLYFNEVAGDEITLYDHLVFNNGRTDAECAALADATRVTMDTVAADTTPPVLSSPNGTVAGATTGTASVTVSEAADVWCLTLAASAADPNAATIEASGTLQTAGAAGLVTFPTRTGLTTGTAYKNWFFAKDKAATPNPSSVVSSSSFTPTAANTAPTFPGNIGSITGTSGSAITPVSVVGQFADTDSLTYSASPTGASWPSGLTINPSTGVISGTLSTGTTTGLRVRATDTASQTVDSNTFNVTIAAASGGGTVGTLATKPFRNGARQVLANLTALNVAVLSLPALNMVKTFSGCTTNGAGVNSVQDAAIVAGTRYAHITTDSAGAVIGSEIIQAT